MKKEFLMGNEAIAFGAIAAGVNVVCGYPGTPSTEVLETVAGHNDGSIYVEWSVNEKAALELAAGAAACKARCLVTMKQVGLNVASDPLMCLEYIGVKAGTVIMVADDPGPISSQTEQDTRTFASYSKLPCFDPSSVQEAYEMIRDAFRLSEECKTPVLFRPTTRICHAYASVEIKEEGEYEHNTPAGYIRDPEHLVIFPKLSQTAHRNIEKRNEELSKLLSGYEKNRIFYGQERPEERDCGTPADPEKAAAAGGLKYDGKAIASHGASFSYAMDALKSFEEKPEVLKISTPFPFPEELAAEFLKDKKEVLCIEELDPVIERALIFVCGKYGLSVKIRGKLTGDMDRAGENTCDSVLAAIENFLNGEKQKDTGKPETGEEPAPELPIRPPVLCAGCPHRASFYAVKAAMKGRKCAFCGDIGCYTLGNAKPLDMTDTCLCMGAGVNMAQGIHRADPDTTCFAFVGDSTFFAAAITGAVNAMYNQTDMILVVLDNSTTAMTGHQPHPGTGVRMMSFAKNAHPEPASKISIEGVLRGIGLETVEVVDPLDLPKAIETVKTVADKKGVRAIIFRSPCIALVKASGQAYVDPDKCIGCKKCITSIGCPGIVTENGKAVIDASQCTGCMLCAKLCPVKAIGGAGHE